MAECSHRRPAHPTARELMAGSRMDLSEVVTRWREALHRSDEACLEALLQTLSGLPPEMQLALLEFVKTELTSQEEERRYWAVRALSALEIEETASSLIAAAQDESPMVAQAAVLALRLHPTVRAIPVLLAALNAPQALTRRLAGDALVAIGSPTVPHLLEVLRNGAPLARREAARALALLGDRQAIPLLIEALGDDSLYIGYWANEGLERLGVGMVFLDPNSA